MHFASDNTSGVPEAILNALAAANSGFAPSYGADPLTERVRDRLRALFEAPKAEVFLVTTGTAANALALATYCPPWAAIFCHRHAHIQEDECGAPEFYTTGAKLVLVDGAHGKIDPAALAEALKEAAATGVHSVQRGMLSLTNLTEAGTAYAPEEIAALAGHARRYGLPVHLDGARFANALVSLNTTPAALSWKAGVDILSLGGTKNGLLGVEAVILFDPARAWEFQLRRKRAGHLLSKHRFLAAQVDAWLANDLWLDLARQANAMAARLARGLLTLPGAELVHPVDGNIIFARLPRRVHQCLRVAGAHYYLWPLDQPQSGDPDAPLTCRLVASWSTTEAEVDAFLAVAREAAAAGVAGSEAIGSKLG